MPPLTRRDTMRFVWSADGATVWAAVAGAAIVAVALESTVLAQQPSTATPATAAADGGGLPGWTPRPDDLPPELRPIELQRPALSAEAATEIERLQARIGELRTKGLTDGERAAQDAALDEAIQLAERAFLTREAEQGNGNGRVRWRNAKGETSEWYEVGDARRVAASLRTVRALDPEGRAALASVRDADAETSRLFGEGKFAEAMSMAERHAEIARRTLGAEHPETIGAVNDIGVLLQARGSLADAERFFRESLATYRHALGDEHPDTLRSLNNMGSLLQAAGKLAEAEPYLREALTNYRRTLGDDHPDTLISIDNMGNFLQAAGKLAEAEPYCRLALARRRITLGEEHQATLASINNVGTLLQAQGKLAEAEPYYREALARRRRTLGEEHPETIVSISAYGELLSARGRIAEAEPFYREALEKSRRALGNEHPSTLYAINSMASLLQAQGKLTEAEPLYGEALATRRRVLGDGHPETIASISNMGFFRQAQGRFAEAERCDREAFEKFRRTLGADHPETIRSISNLGSLIKSDGRLAEAEPYSREAVAKFRNLYGEDHPDTLRATISLCALLQAQGKFAEVEPYCRDVLARCRRIFGDEHPVTLRAVNNMGFLLQAQGKLDEAEPRFREALTIQRRTLGPDHPDTLTSLCNISALLQAQGKLSEAESMLREATERSRRTLGDEHPDTLVLVGNLGLLLVAESSYAEAERLLAEALEKRRRSLGPEQADTLVSLNTMAFALASEGKFAEAEPLYAEALALAERLRVRVAGDAQDRAAFAGTLDLNGIALRHALLLARLERPAEAFAVLERGRGRAGLDLFAGGRTEAERLLRASRDAGAIQRYDRALAEEGDARAALAEAEAQFGMATAEQRDLLRDQVKAARVALAERTAAVFAALRGLVPQADPLGTDRVLASLGPGEAILTYAWTGEGAAAFLARDGAVRAITLSADRPHTAALADAVDALRSRIAHRPATEEAIPATLIAAARDAVLPGSLRSMLEGVTSLTVIADGPVAGVPFEVLALGDAPLTGIAVAYAPSATIALDRRRASQDRLAASHPPRDAAVVLGDPRFAPPGAAPAPDAALIASARAGDSIAANAAALEQVRFYGGSLAQLPATRLEATAVASLLGERATLLLGERATSALLRAAVEAAPPRVLHLATHGLLGSGDRPLLASLALTAPAEPTPGDIGFLTLEEILATWGSRLRGTELVVLSACDTARGVRQGDTTMALPLGLFVCGAETVVASLWEVDDTATSLLMARLYANWLGRTDSQREIDGVRYEAGRAMPKLAALREAQRWLRTLTVADRDRLVGASAEIIAGEGTRGDPRAARGTLGQARADSHPYDHPFYWAAFTLQGSER